MNLLEEYSVSCPWCGEWIDLTIDCSVEQQRYVEDCPVCCRAMDVSVVVDFSSEPPLQVTCEAAF